MLRKKESYTTITPIPTFIPRQLALDILQSHSEVITLNPLVIDHKPIPPPRNAAADEYYSTWYEVSQRIQWVPGMGKMGSGRISFNACFHDMPWGLQTHTYAAANTDIRIKYRIAGNQSGVEGPEHREIGLERLGAPKDGLYLREDIEIKCNIAMVSFVKAQQKAASKEMVSRIIKKAELLDAGVLQAMMEGGKLKTVNPNDRSAGNQANRMTMSSVQQHSAFPPGSPSPDPEGRRPGTTSPLPTSPGPVPYRYPSYRQSLPHPQALPPQFPQGYSEMMGDTGKMNEARPMELPGNDSYIYDAARSPPLHPQHQHSQSQQYFPQQGFYQQQYGQPLTQTNTNSSSAYSVQSPQETPDFRNSLAPQPEEPEYKYS